MLQWRQSVVFTLVCHTIISLEEIQKGEFCTSALQQARPAKAFGAVTAPLSPGLPLREVSAPMAQGSKDFALQSLGEKPPFLAHLSKAAGFPSSAYCAGTVLLCQLRKGVAGRG